MATEKVLDLVSFYQRTPFRTERTATKYFKISLTDRTKEWKIYDKGIQFPELNQDILRVEVRIKKAKNIRRKTGARHIGDLLKIDTFSRYFELFINDFDNIFFCGDAEYFLKLKGKINENDNRNLWGKEKEKHLKNRPHLIQLKTKIKGQLIDIFNSAISPQRTPINKGKFDSGKDYPSRVNGDSALFRVCEVTKIDISMQRKSSKFLCNSGLKFYHENQPEVYRRLANEFLTDDKRNADLQTQFYYLSHNIRNVKTNNFHNRQRFEQRNYPPNQLQLFP